ncbi:MAG: hypothetical protein ABSG59_19095 [Verrucomicrobiota bacterium]
MKLATTKDDPANLDCREQLIARYQRPFTRIRLARPPRPQS